MGIFKENTRLGLIFSSQEKTGADFATRLIFALRCRATHLERASRETHPELCDAVYSVCRQSGMEQMPSIYLYDSKPDYANAVAGGKELLGFSKSIVNLLEKEELQSVIGHEIGHLKNHDRVARVRTLARGVASAAGVWMAKRGGRGSLGKVLGMQLISHYITSAAIAPLKRSEEFSADRYGALIANDPEPIITGLIKIRDHNKALQKDKQEIPLLSDAMKLIRKPLRSHPTIEQRAEALGVSYERLKAQVEAEKTGVSKASAESFPPHTPAATTEPRWQEIVQERLKQRAAAMHR